MEWTLFSWCSIALFEVVVVVTWLRWSAKKNTNLAVVPADDAAAVLPAGEEEVDRMIQRLIETEGNDLTQYLVQAGVNFGITLLIVSFLMYGTFFRQNDGSLVWAIVLILLFLLQSISTHQATELTHVGSKFIRKTMSNAGAGGGPDLKPSLWKRMTRCYNRYFSTKTDGLFAEWILLLGEGIEIQVQVLLKTNKRHAYTKRIPHTHLSFVLCQET